MLQIAESMVGSILPFEKMGMSPLFSEEEHFSLQTILN